jgi:hypothetical protein
MQDRLIASAKPAPIQSPRTERTTTVSFPNSNNMTIDEVVHPSKLGALVRRLRGLLVVGGGVAEKPGRRLVRDVDDTTATETQSPEPAPLLSGSSRTPATCRALEEPAAAARAGDLVPRLRWLLTESAGTTANVAHLLETSAAEVDDNARAQLYEDVSVLEEELATVKALLGNYVDWDAEVKRLLGGEVPPLPGHEDQAGESFG